MSRPIDMPKPEPSPAAQKIADHYRLTDEGEFVAHPDNMALVAFARNLLMEEMRSRDGIETAKWIMEHLT